LGAERFVVLEDGQFEIGQRRAGIETEFIAEDAWRW
jgi:hypothetical protein